MIRNQLLQKNIDKAFEQVDEKINYRLSEKGWGAYAGPHEAYGIVAEEFKELMDALQKNNREEFYKELIDIAVACILGMASDLPDDTSAEEGEIE